mgnify:CR=1 FL=1
MKYAIKVDGTSYSTNQCGNIMRIENFKWKTLYEKVDNFMKSIKTNEYSIATNRMSVVNNEPIL